VHQPIAIIIRFQSYDAFLNITFRSCCTKLQ